MSDQERLEAALRAVEERLPETPTDEPPTDERAIEFELARQEVIEDMIANGTAVRVHRDETGQTQIVRFPGNAEQVELPPRFDDPWTKPTGRSEGRPAYVRPWHYGAGNGIERQLAGERQTGLYYG